MKYQLIELFNIMFPLLVFVAGGVYHRWIGKPRSCSKCGEKF